MVRRIRTAKEAMRGWMFVASAADRPGQVRIGQSNRDPELLMARLGRDRLCLEYDALVEEPRVLAADVRRRLAAIRSSGDWFRCTPEFAAAAIHHATRGSIALERVHEQVQAVRVVGSDVHSWSTPLDVARAEYRAPQAAAPVQPIRPVAPPPIADRPNVRAKDTASPFAKLLVWLVAAAAIAATALLGDLSLPHHRAPPADPAQVAEPAPTPAPAAAEPQAMVSDTPAPPLQVAAAAAPEVPPRAAPADCGAIWRTSLPACRSVAKSRCTNAVDNIPEPVRRDLREESRRPSFDMRAFANFCRAACRHGYVPAQADFSATVCRSAG
jgi:hypothetical protein